MTNERMFQESMKFMLKNEGGYSNHPNDRGGKTFKGITEGTLSRARQAGLTDKTDVKTLDDTDVNNIYKQFYWKPSKAYFCDFPLSVIHFDAAVNHGVRGAVKILQNTLNSLINCGLVIDGIAGTLTLSALEKAQKSGVAPLCEEYNAQRKEKYRQIIKLNPSQVVFEKGWMNRILRCQEYCQNHIQ